MVTLITGAIITALICTGLVSLTWYLKDSAAVQIRIATAKNCIADAIITNCEYDEEREIATAVYMYQYKGQRYEYERTFFGQEPPDAIKVMWSHKHPDKCYEVTELSSDSKRTIITRLPWLAGGTLLAALILPQLCMIFVCGIMLCWSNRAALLCKIGLVWMCLSLFFASGEWLQANIDPFAYNNIRYSISSYDEYAMQLAVIDELEPWEISVLYENIRWMNVDISEARVLAETPVFGQYANKHLLRYVELEWPLKYARYSDYDYRNTMKRMEGSPYAR